MRNIVLILVLLISIGTFAQKKHPHASTQGLSAKTDTTSVKKTPITGYVAIEFAMSNGNAYDTNENKYNFSESSFPSVEVGVNIQNIAVGINVGRKSFDNSVSDTRENYYSELRLVPLFPLGAVNANLIFGAGSYFAPHSTFIEYGTGIEYSIGKYDYGLNYANFDGVDYISLSLAYNFNF